MPRWRLRALLGGVAGLYLGTAPRPVAPPAADLRARALIARLGDTGLRRGRIDAPVFRPDGTTLAAGGDSRSDVIEWDVASGRERRRYTDPVGPCQFVTVLGYTPAAARLIAPLDFARLLVFDTTTSAVTCRVEGFLAASADLRRAVGRGHDGVLRVWDLGTGRPVALGTDTVSDVAFSPGGAWVAAGFYHDPPLPDRPLKATAYRGEAWVWPAARGPRRTLTLPGKEHSNGVSVVWVGPGRVVAWTSYYMALFDAVTGARLATASPSGSAVTSGRCGRVRPRHPPPAARAHPRRPGRGHRPLPGRVGPRGVPQPVHSPDRGPHRGSERRLALSLLLSFNGREALLMYGESWDEQWWARVNAEGQIVAGPFRFASLVTNDDSE